MKPDHAFPLQLLEPRARASSGRQRSLNPSESASHLTSPHLTSASPPLPLPPGRPCSMESYEQQCGPQAGLPEDLASLAGLTAYDLLTLNPLRALGSPTHALHSPPLPKLHAAYQPSHPPAAAGREGGSLSRPDGRGCPPSPPAPLLTLHQAPPTSLSRLDELEAQLAHCDSESYVRGYVEVGAWVYERGEEGGAHFAHGRSPLCH
jgi:hypothetical protein